MPGRYRAIIVLISACLVVLYGIALATDPPHNDPESVYCNNCHVTHASLGPSLTNNASNSNLCLSCHTTSGQASNWPFSSSDQAVPGTSGKSHRWDGAMPATASPGNAYGLTTAANLSSPALKTMLTKFSGVVTCSVCHQQHKQSASPWDPFAFNSWPGGDSGAANAAGTTLTVVTGKTWSTNQWAGFYATMTGGTTANIGQSRLIASNTATTLTLATALSAATASGDTFAINGIAAGSATAAGTTTTITDSTKGWTANQWVNAYIIMNGGTAANLFQPRLISANTANTLTFAALPAVVAANDTYYITQSGTTTAASWNITTGATGGSTTTVIDTTQTTWTANQWKGYYVKMTGGLNNGLERRLAGNTTTTLTIDTSGVIPSATAFPNAVAAGDTYYIKSGRHFMRTNNALNDMCVDCHAYRNIQDVTTYTGNPLSHPIGKQLNNVKDPTQFFMIGREPASAAWAAQQGGRGEINGGTNTNYTNNAVVGLDNEVNCLSCHGIHYTDSDSSTIDQP